MTKRITYTFDTPFANKSGDDSGEMEFPDDATDEEIEEAVKEAFFERYNYGWSHEP